MGMSQKKAQEILGLSDNYTEEQLKKAYKRAAARNHPDKFTKADAAGKEIAKKKFQEIQEAYGVLDNPYSHAGNHNAGFGGDAQWGGFTYDDMQKMWEEKLKSTEAPFRNHGAHSKQTATQTIYITLEQAQKGTVYVLKAEDVTMCKKCHGTGVVLREGGQRPLRCGDCGQTGNRGDTIEKRVNIPAGVTDGSTISVDVVLSASTRTYKITVKHKPHDVFISKGKHLYRDVDVPLHNMIVGGKYPVDTLDGVGLITLKPNTQNRLKLRIPNKGLGDGDLYVTLHAKLPESLDEYRNIINDIDNLDETAA